MNPLSLIGKLFSGGNIVKDTGEALDKLFTSDDERMEKKLETEKAELNFQLETAKLESSLALGQIDINKEEAKSTNWFVAGWRPAVGWMCVTGLGYQFLIYTFLTWASENFGWKVPPPLDTTTLTTLLFGMLGLGGLRTFEKVKDVHENH